MGCLGLTLLDSCATSRLSSGIRGQWYLLEHVGGFRSTASPLSRYTPTNTHQRLSFGTNGVFVREFTDTAGRVTSRTTHKYEVTVRRKDRNFSKVIKVGIRYTPGLRDRELDTLWLKDNLLVTEILAPLHCGVSSHFARVSK